MKRLLQLVGSSAKARWNVKNAVRERYLALAGLAGALRNLRRRERDEQEAAHLAATGNSGSSATDDTQVQVESTEHKRGTARQLKQHAFFD